MYIFCSNGDGNGRDHRRLVVNRRQRNSLGGAARVRGPALFSNRSVSSGSQWDRLPGRTGLRIAQSSDFSVTLVRKHRCTWWENPRVTTEHHAASRAFVGMPALSTKLHGQSLARSMSIGAVVFRARYDALIGSCRHRRCAMRLLRPSVGEESARNWLRQRVRTSTSVRRSADRKYKISAVIQANEILCGCCIHKTVSRQTGHSLMRIHIQNTQ